MPGARGRTRNATGARPARVDRRRSPPTGTAGATKRPRYIHSPRSPTKLEHALKTAISAAYNAERFGAELGYVVRFDADAIKSMAITVLINMSGENRR